MSDIKHEFKSKASSQAEISRLTDKLNAFCDEHGLPHESADELLHSLLRGGAKTGIALPVAEGIYWRMGGGGVSAGKVALHLGDCLEVMRSIESNSIDSIVTDPPYAFPGGFMGKGWDNFDGREDAGFGYWLAGFTDGEGCFRVQRHERGTHVCAFQIKLRRDDRSVLERIHRFVGYGSINNVTDTNSTSNPQATYVVQDKEGCERLVGLFRKYPLAAKKALDFEIWADAVEEWLGRPRGNRWQGASDQTRAATLKERIENVRRYTDVPWSGNRFQDWCRLWAIECLRVLKPGGHLLAFGAPRGYHRLASGIEDAGFEVRDSIHWIFGSGFPKSHNLEGEWNGWGTALKPAHEPVVVARKPLVGTVAENVARHGTGALNIDGCRVGTADLLRAGAGGLFSHVRDGKPYPNSREGEATAENRYADRGSTPFALTPGPQGGDSRGRWPANLIHDGSEEILAAFPDAPGQSGAVTGREPSSKTNNVYGQFDGRPETRPRGDKGSAARFFYCAKASRKDRDEGCESFDKKPLNWSSGDQNPGSFQSQGTEKAARNHHPTVKPTELMRYLCRLVTPPGGTVLDPFMGSGSTGKAALLEGFRFVGIEREPEYFEIAKARVAPGLEQPEMILAMPKPKTETEKEPDLFGFSAA